MSWSRREFITTTCAGILGAPALGRTLAPASVHTGDPLKVLVLGGTKFLGPAVVKAAKSRGHAVTIFTRGFLEKLYGEEFEGVERLHGNRDPEKFADEEGKSGPKGLEQLKGRKWDVILDTSGKIPELVKASSELLADSCKYYLFISSMVAYKTDSIPNADETSPRLEPGDTCIWGDGVLKKTLCEPEVQKVFGDRACILRPGYIIGGGDDTDRFNYWPLRIKRGGEILAPGTPDDPMQIIDVRDLAEFMVHCGEQRTGGVMNVLGPQKPYRWGDVLETCRRVAKSDAKFTWVDWEFLKSQGLEEGDAPIWMSPTPEFAGFFTKNNDRALKAGLKLRPLADTMSDIITRYDAEMKKRSAAAKRSETDLKGAKLPATVTRDPAVRTSGLTPEKEKQILAAWHARKPG